MALLEKVNIFDSIDVIINKHRERTVMGKFINL